MCVCPSGMAYCEFACAVRDHAAAAAEPRRGGGERERWRERTRGRVGRWRHLLQHSLANAHLWGPAATVRLTTHLPIFCSLCLLLHPLYLLTLRLCPNHYYFAGYHNILLNYIFLKMNSDIARQWYYNNKKNNTIVKLS